MGKGKTLVSACLVGILCRYDGRRIRRLKKDNINFIPVCPEQLGGLPTPRARSILSTGSGLDVLKGKAKVVSDDDRDVTENFLRGAYEVSRIVKLFNIKEAYLKSKSPSCGTDGVTTALLRKMKIEIHFV